MPNDIDKIKEPVRINSERLSLIAFCVVMLLVRTCDDTKLQKDMLENSNKQIELLETQNRLLMQMVKDTTLRVK